MIFMRPKAFFPMGCHSALWYSLNCVQGSTCDQPRNNPFELLHHGWELNPGHREDRQWAIPLSYHDPGTQGGQTVSYATVLSWPRPQRGQTVSYPTKLSCPRDTGRTNSELCHCAIMTQATERTDSELSHWAIMTRATGRTGSELSHWAIR